MEAFGTAVRTVAYHEMPLGNTLHPRGRIRLLPILRIGEGVAICS